MPKKQTVLSDEERSKRIKETARDIEAGNDPEAFERVFKTVVKSSPDKTLGKLRGKMSHE